MVSSGTKMSLRGCTCTWLTDVASPADNSVVLAAVGVEVVLDIFANWFSGTLFAALTHRHDRQESDIKTAVMINSTEI